MTRRYPAYKDSGVEWLGEVPEGWHVEPLKHNTYLKARVGWKGLNSSEFEVESYAYLITGSDFRGKFVDWSACYQVDEARYADDPYIQLQDGDLLITKDGTIGKLAVVAGLDKPACLNSGIFLIRPTRSYGSDFLYWVLSSNAFAVFCDLRTFGSTINHLYQNVFQDFAFPIPSLPEQSAIAGFLDRETTKIDALVAEQRRLIDLLREKRQAVISHAVTKGLNPNAPLKPSGIDWLGDVPEGWEVVQARRLIAVFEQGYSPECHAYPSSPGEWGVLKSGCVNRGVYREEENKTLPPDIEPRPQWEVSVGDLLMSRASGSPELIGSVAIVEATQGRILMSDKIFRLRLEPIVRTDFAYWMFASDALRAQIVNAISGGDGMANNLPQSSIKEFRTVLPPVSEQEKIAAYLRAQTAKLGAVTATAETAITLLQERRAALISAAVTGKIDVRHLAPKETEAA